MSLVILVYRDQGCGKEQSFPVADSRKASCGRYQQLECVIETEEGGMTDVPWALSRTPDSIAYSVDFVPQNQSLYFAGLLTLHGTESRLVDMMVLR
jgi:hypothetical protein